MSLDLSTDVSAEKIKTVFYGQYEGYVVTTSLQDAELMQFNTKVEYDLSDFDEEAGVYELCATESDTYLGALANHIAFSKLLFVNEPINFTKALIDSLRKESLKQLVHAKNAEITPDFELDFAHQFLDLCNMNPVLP